MEPMETCPQVIYIIYYFTLSIYIIFAPCIGLRMSIWLCQFSFSRRRKRSHCQSCHRQSVPSWKLTASFFLFFFEKMHAARRPNLLLVFMVTWKKRRNKEKKNKTEKHPDNTCHIWSDPLYAENAAEITCVSSGNRGDNSVSRATKKKKKRRRGKKTLRKAAQKKKLPSARGVLDLI